MYRILLYFAILVLFTRCSRPESHHIQQVDYTYILEFVNQTKDAIRLDFYKTKDDYVNATNPFIEIELNETNPVYNMTIADTQVHYYLDMYSDDHRYTNWGKTTNPDKHGKLIPEYDISHLIAQDGRYIIDSVEHLYKATRDFFIKWNDKQSDWKVVDMVDEDNNSIWHLAEDYKKYLLLTIKKDMTFRMEQKNPMGSVIIKEDFFMANGNQRRKYLAAGIKTGNRNTYNFMWNWRASPGQVKTDTLYLQFNSNEYYVLQRQH